MVATNLLTAAAVSGVRASLAVVLADGLPRHPWQLPPGVTGREFLVAVDRHRVSTHLARDDGRLQLPQSIAGEITEMDRTERMNAMRLVHALCRASDALTAAGVRHLTFKGAALAQQLYGNFAARGFGDIDLLVAPDDVATAHGVLLAAGWRGDPGWPAPGGSWAWRSLLQHYFSVPLGGQIDLDLQWRLHPLARDPLSFETYWARREEVSIAGRMIPTLGRYDALAHSASHAARDDWSWLRSLVDVHTLAAYPGTWRMANRPLTSAELDSVGVAVRCFGRPSSPPAVLDEAVMLSGSRWAGVVARQAGRSVADPGDYLPGVGYLEAAGRLLRGGRTLAHVGDALWGLAVRPDRIGDLEQTTLGAVLPALITRRVSGARGQLRRYRGSASA